MKIKCHGNYPQVIILKYCNWVKVEVTQADNLSKSYKVLAINYLK